MKELTDDNLNKLIDNELNNSEIDELYLLIKNNDELLSKTKAHQMVNSVLKGLKIENAPENTTELIMAKISASILVKERKNGLFKFMIGALSLSLVLILGFIVFSDSGNQQNSFLQLSFIKNFVNSHFSNFSIPIESKLLSIISASITVILLITGYFIVEQHKSFKQKLDRIL